MGLNCLINKQYVIDLNKNYLLLEISDNKDSYKTHMLAENDITGLLRLNFTRVNNEQQFMYDISSMQSVEKLLSSKKAGYEDIRSIIQGICVACESIKKYLLKSDNIIFQPEMIYICPETGEVKFVLNPYHSEPVWQQLRELSRYFIGKINYTDIEAVTCVYKFNEIVMQDNFVLGDIIKALEVELEEQEEDSNKESNEYADETVEVKTPGLFEKLTGIIRNRFYPQLVCEQESEYKVNYNEQEEVKEEIGATLLMHTIKEREFYLKCCSSNYEDIKITKKGVIIGKLEKNVDVVVNDVSISRIHAKAEVSGEKCYIEDLNTTNGTYINGKRLIPYKLEEVREGDKVNLGCIEYVIRNC